MPAGTTKKTTKRPDPVAVMRDFTLPYSAAESWLYDFWIAPAVMALRPAMMARLIAELPEGAKVLEVGCGGGHLAVELLERRGDLRYVGLDLSAEQVGRARRRLAGANHAELVQGSALDLPFDRGRFDAVISVASIKHWPDPAKGVSECVRVLAPGGLLAIVEADRGCTLDDANALVSGLKMPRALLPLALALFRTWVAGRSLDMDEARALLAAEKLDGAEVTRLEGTPALFMTGHAPSPG